MNAAAERRTAHGRRIAALFLAAIAGGLITPVSAGAGPAAPELTLVSQDAWTAMGGDLHAKLGVEQAGAGFTLSVVAHQALATRSAFDRTVEGANLGSVLDQVVIPLETLPSDANGSRELSLGLELPDGPRLAERLGTRRPGVYPLEFELRDANDETQAGFVTYLTAVASFGTVDTVTSPLGVAWVWPLSAAPATLPGDGASPEVIAQLEPDGRLGRQVDALDRSAGVPITVVPGPETVQTWAALAQTTPALADGAAALRRALGTHQMVAGPYVPVDLPSLIRAGLTAAVDAELVEGNEALRDFFGTRLDPRTAVTQPIDGATVDRLLAGGIDRVVVDASALVQRSTRLTVAQPFALEEVTSLATGSQVTAVASDTGLAGLLNGDGSPALRAQRLLAGLAVVALEDSDSARAVTIVNPSDFNPSADLIDAVLTGLRANPWLTPMTIDTVFEQIPAETSGDGTPVTRELVAYEPPVPHVTAAAYDAAQLRLSALRAFAPDTPTIPLADHSLLASVSSAWNRSGGAARAAAELANIDNVIGLLLAKIHVPSRSTITLTDRSGAIPLTFRNDTEETVNVLVELQSPKLSFPDGVQRIIELPPKNTTVRVAVESRTSGSFPLQLTVRSADGVLPIARSEFEVQATAVSAVGLVLIISALVFLTLWWALHIRRDRVRRRVATQGVAA